MAKDSSKGSKSSGGGGAAQALPTPTNQVTLPTPQQVEDGDVLPQGGIAFSKFESMTDDQKAQVVSDALKTGTPMFLDDSGIQRFAYFTGMNDTPKVVSDSALDAVKGPSLYRTVNNVYDAKKDIGYTSTDIAKQITDGDFTMFSDSGGSAYGKAIYFAQGYSSSAVYGRSGANPVTMRAKITSGKVISDSQADSMYRSALNSGDKLALACSKADHASGRNLYVLAKGYDAISAGNSSGAYHMILNRRCLTVSSTVKPTQRGGTWK